MDEVFTEKLRDELPVFWEFIPLTDWFIVFENFKDYLRQKSDDETDISFFLENRIKRLTKINKSLEIIEKILDHRLLGASSFQVAISIIEHFIFNK